MRHLVVGTAGHIDHGKSTLVKALTGVDPDRLKEEQARGITIELGFADLELEDDRRISFVDVPGHERFVRHMVAGATGVDAVLLVVAADEGVMPQTREHLEICRLLDVGHGIVALSKSDLAEPELVEVVELELREQLAGTFLEDAPIVQVSAQTGNGLEALRAELNGLFGRVPARAVHGVPRLPVDRSFVLKGFGTVVTGTLVSGTLAPGDEVEVFPSGKRGRVRSLQVHHREVPQAVAGQRTAVNLQGLERGEVPRGATLTTRGALISTRRLIAEVELLPGIEPRHLEGGQVRLHQGTAERNARLHPLGRDAPEGLMSVRLDEPALLVPGDRFILRLPAPVHTIGGGVVLDSRPPRRLSDDQRARLRDTDPVEAAGLRLERAGFRGASPGALAAELGRSAAEIDQIVQRLAEQQSARVFAGQAFSGPTWERVRQQVVEVLTAFHRDEPLRPGISREELRGRISGEIPLDGWRGMLELLQQEGVVRLEGEWVGSSEHRVELSDADEARVAELEARFREAGLDPLAPADVLQAGDDRDGRLIEWLFLQGRLLKLPDGRVLHADAEADLLARLREYRQTSSRIDVGAFKELAGVSRKNAIPLLEHLDSRRKTRRIGNMREILDA